MNLSDMTWPAVAAISKDTPVVIPIAALEQHGHHLPVFTDSMLLGEIIRRVSETKRESAIFTPLMWLGNSDHHLDFPGTMSAAPRTYLDLLTSLIENMLVHGFRRILLINGHGGNDVPGKQATFEVRQRHRDRSDLLLLFATYWGLGAEPGRVDSSFQQQEMGHACEWETSMILRIAPHLVGDYKSAKVVEPGNPFRPATRAWITRDRSQVGHIGWPHLATAEKGEKLFELFSRDVESMISRMRAWDGISWDG